MRIVGLFAGIGGIETGFRAALGEAAHTELLCEWWPPAQRVLAARFGEVPLHPDVRELRELPAGIDVLAAGFPCTDLSQAGRTAGITGGQSGLVGHVFEALRLTATRRRRLPWLVIENVPNMLSLDRGQAMRYLVGELEALGYRWAYRVVDSRFTGVPQRRRRVLLVASADHDPREVLFADEASEMVETGQHAEDAYGFYWTEGRSGLGWARDAVPTLKGGSTLGIASPPAVWVPGAPPGRRLVTPQIEDAEALQGFARGWTAPAEDAPRRNGPRWKLVGNAVTVGVARWLAGRIAEPGEVLPLPSESWSGSRSWPTAAWGERGQVWRMAASEYPRLEPYRHLLDVMDAETAPALSHRAAAGFLGRLQRGNLGRHPGFREDVARHVELTEPRGAGLAAEAAWTGGR
ncbi:MAG: DNA cytosine methyltransferase [Kineosporiaceae bacterium]|nr:DNA cytosine methyltransferase [Kineosporiaceae bacterium]MBK7623441.1 DNA cytosine methyltransferase [Kineosporiaceae bacterium]MBK8074017.1 DNA cytosine methyltransferase [Kineosporiaceae bacterium]